MEVFKVEGGVGSLLVEASNACNLIFLRGGSPNVHANYNSH